MNVGMVAVIGLTGVLALSGPTHAQSKRQLGAHVHGASKLNIAIDGQTVTMELSAPANDIVGFEHPPRTDKQKAAVEQAMQTLQDPFKLFTLPRAAGCTVASTAVERKLEDAKPAATTADEVTHSEFEGRYSLTCTNAIALLDIEFPYFKLFPKADEIEVQVIVARGQKSFEVKRARPRLSLRNLTS